MAEYGTDSIQAIVNLYPRFDGKDKTQFLEYKDKLRVSLSFKEKIRTHLDLLSIPRLWGKKCQNV